MDGPADVRVLDVAGKTDLDPGAPAGAVSEAVLRPGNEERVGRRGCYWSNREGAGPWSVAEVRHGSFDQAGNFSGWSPPALAGPIGSEGGGCSAAGGAPAGAWTVALAWAWRVRRRGSRR